MFVNSKCSLSALYPLLVRELRKITKEKIFRVFGLNINFKNTRSNCNFVKNLIDSRSKELEKLK